MKTYTQKDLGYPRTATAAEYEVTMPDGSLWRVPVQIIADSRDEYYADEKEDTIGFIRAGGLDEFKIRDWAENNMNWSEVSEFAIVQPRKPVKVDYEDGWANGNNQIIGDV